MITCLEEQCLYFIIANLEHFHVWSLSLVPTVLRRRLLLNLPLVDLCRFERLPIISNDINMEAVWEQLIKKRGLSSSLYFQKMPTHRDSFLNAVARALLLDVPPEDQLLKDLGNLQPRNCMTVKRILLVSFLFSVECREQTPLSSFVAVNNHSSMYLPRRYSLYRTRFTLLDGIVQFNKHCCWFPRVLDISYFDCFDKSLKNFEDVTCPGNNNLECLFARMEEIHLKISADDIEDFGMDAVLVLLRAAAKASSYTACLKVITISGCVTILEQLLPQLFDIFATDNYREYRSQSDNTVTYTKLKTIKIIGNDSGGALQMEGKTCNLYNCRENLAAILASQVELEEVVLEGMMNIQKEFGCFIYESATNCKGFDDLFHFLPALVMKPSFRSLCVSRSLIPANALANIVRAFLNTPTTHLQNVDISGSLITQGSSPLAFLPIVFPKIPATTFHSSLNLKSLSIPFSSSDLFPPESLLDYQLSTLRKLEIVCHPDSNLDIQRICDTVSRLPVDHISIQFHVCQDTLTFQGLTQEVMKVLWSPSIKLLGFRGFSCIQDGLLTILTQGLLQRTKVSHLRTLQLNRMKNLDVVDLQPLYKAIFALPQLSELTLDLSNNNFSREEHQSLIEAFRASTKDTHKLQKLIYTSNDCHTTNPVPDAIRNIAVELEL